MFRAVTVLCVLLAGVGCNSHERQCDKLVGSWNELRAVLEAASRASSKGALDQLIFGLTRQRADLLELELPDVRLDLHRRALVTLLDADIAALRAYAEVSERHDTADVEDLRDTLYPLTRDERKIVDAVNQECSGRGSP